MVEIFYRSENVNEIVKRIAFGVSKCSLTTENNVKSCRIAVAINGIVENKSAALLPTIAECERTPRRRYFQRETLFRFYWGGVDESINY